MAYLVNGCPHQLETPKSYLIFFFLSASINSKAKTGWTSLHYAAMKGYTALVEYLIKKHNATIDSLTMVNDILIDYYFSAEIKILYTFRLEFKKSSKITQNTIFKKYRYQAILKKRYGSIVKVSTISKTTFKFLIPLKNLSS